MQAMSSTNSSMAPTSSAMGPTGSAVGRTSSAVVPTSSAFAPTSSAVVPTSSAVGPTNSLSGPRYRLRTGSNFGMPASPYLPDQADRLRLQQTDLALGEAGVPFLPPPLPPSPASIVATQPAALLASVLQGAAAGAVDIGDASVTVATSAAAYAAPSVGAPAVPPPAYVLPTHDSWADTSASTQPWAQATTTGFSEDWAHVQHLQLSSLLSSQPPVTSPVAPGAPRVYVQQGSPTQQKPYAPPPTYKTAQDNGKTKATTQDARTTVMLRNLPPAFTRTALLQMLDSEGFAGTYDFAYLPFDFETLASLNHAFVNFSSAADADRCHEHFEGFATWPMLSQNICTVAWNDRQQGLAALVERYRNSPVMHDSVPEDCKPMIILSGARTQFPPPTQKIKAPKIMKGKQ